MKVLEDTPAVLSLKKLCDEHGYSYEWINGQTPHLQHGIVSSESVARQERRDPCGIDPYPAAVSSKHVERQERGDPLYSDSPEWLQEFRENLVDDRVPEHRLTRQFFSPTRSADLGEHSVYTHYPKDRN